MQKLHKNALFILFIIFLLTVQCEDFLTINDPLKKDRVNIMDVWIEDPVDLDGDGFYSGCKVFYDLSCNDNKIKAYSWFGYREKDAAKSESYIKCFVSTQYYVRDDEYVSRYMHIKSFSDSLKTGYYNFYLSIVNPNNGIRFDQEDGYSDQDFYNIPLESVAHDTI